MVILKKIAVVLCVLLIVSFCGGNVAAAGEIHVIGNTYSKDYVYKLGCLTIRSPGHYKILKVTKSEDVLKKIAVTAEADEVKITFFSQETSSVSVMSKCENIKVNFLFRGIQDELKTIADVVVVPKCVNPEPVYKKASKETVKVKRPRGELRTSGASSGDFMAGSPRKKVRCQGLDFGEQVSAAELANGAPQLSQNTRQKVLCDVRLRNSYVFSRQMEEKKSSGSCECNKTSERIAMCDIGKLFRKISTSAMKSSKTRCLARHVRGTLDIVCVDKDRNQAKLSSSRANPTSKLAMPIELIYGKKAKYCCRNHDRSADSQIVSCDRGTVRKMDPKYKILVPETQEIPEKDEL